LGGLGGKKKGVWLKRIISKTGGENVTTKTLWALRKTLGGEDL